MTTTIDQRLTAEERAYYTLNRRAYAILAPVFETIVAPFRSMRPEVARIAGVGPGSRVLDVAMGTGAEARALAQTGAEIVGVDISEAMLRVARKKTAQRNVRYQQGDATQLAFEDGCFDVSTVSFALHEMPESIRLRVLSEMKRVTKPDGRIVVVDYGLPKHPLAAKIVFRFVKLYERDHYAEFVRSDWSRLFDRAGLTVKSDQPLLWGMARVVVATQTLAL